MQEAFLHYIWQHHKFKPQLFTTAGEVVLVKRVGVHNHNAGPDFFNAQLTIGSQLWAGNVEIHVKSSDWYVHRHEQDKAYDTVILHVVWEHDVEVFRSDNSVLPTLVLKSYVDTSLLNNYDKLLATKSKWINCEADFATLDDFLLTNWLERLAIERLQQKSDKAVQLLENSKNDWEAVLFKLLAKNFGLKVNGASFLSMAQSFSYGVLRKSQSQLQTLEALLLGQLGLLEIASEAPYVKTLLKEYAYLQHKFNLDNSSVVPAKFFRLRPLNFPTIRLAQLAALYYKHKNLCALILERDTRDDFYKLFNVETAPFWNTHYTFQTESKPSKKRLSKAFVDLLLINTIIPFKFAYASARGQQINETLLNLMQQIKPENNTIIKRFNGLKPIAKSALQSQALLQLKTHYCDKNKCVNCAVGNAILIK